MGKAIGPRLDRLVAQIGWRLTTLTDGRGREMTVQTGALIDAWLAYAMTGALPTSLPRRVSMFLASARLRNHDGEMLHAVRDACRDLWREEDRR